MQIITNYSVLWTAKGKNLLELKALIDTNCQQVIMRIVVDNNLACFYNMLLSAVLKIF